MMNHRDTAPPAEEADDWDYLPGLQTWVRVPEVDRRDVFERNPKWWQQKLDEARARGFKEMMLPVLAYSLEQLALMRKFVALLSSRGYHVREIMLDEKTTLQFRVKFPPEESE